MLSAYLLECLLKWSAPPTAPPISLARETPPLTGTPTAKGAVCLVASRRQSQKYFLTGGCTVFNTASSAALRFHCAWGCWNWTQDCCDFGIGSQSSNHSARSHPQTQLDLIHSRLDLIHYLARSHPLSARSHSHSARSYPHSARSHPHWGRSHPHWARSHPSQK